MTQHGDNMHFDLALQNSRHGCWETFSDTHRAYFLLLPQCRLSKWGDNVLKNSYNIYLATNLIFFSHGKISFSG